MIWNSVLPHSEIGMHTSSTLTKVNTLNGPIILADNNGVTYPEGIRVDQHESLLCLNQCRAFGWAIDESAQIYGGQQCMKYTLNDVDYIIPLVFCHGWTILPIEEPTDSEIRTLPILNLTDPDPQNTWAPKRMDTIEC